MQMVQYSEKWKQGLLKTKKKVLGRISEICTGRKHIDNNFLEDLEEILIQGDLGVEITLNIIDELRNQVFDVKNNIEEEVRIILKEKILELISNEERIFRINFQEKPYVIMVVGVNGTGKTTTIGKMAYHFKEEGKKILLAGADTFRAAAAEQLEVWGKCTEVDVVRQSMGADPASVAFDALDAAIVRGVDILIVDTAGRLHTKVNLMEELRKIHRVLKKRMVSAPHEVLLVLDATTGQNGLNQAIQFTNAVDVTGIVLTKLDGTARGGIVVTIYQTLGIPVKWLGVGEGVEDLIEFNAETFVEGMFG